LAVANLEEKREVVTGGSIIVGRRATSSERNVFSVKSNFELLRRLGLSIILG